jgi:hypothetical protein
MIGLVLLVLGAPCWAQVSGLYNADVIDRTSVGDPATAVKAAGSGWLAFSIPALDGTGSPCCWKGRWDGPGEAGCSLENRHQSYGSRPDSGDDDNVIVFAKVNDSEITDLRVLGESCPVDAGGAKVTWIGDVNEKAGLDWLEEHARSDRDHAALHAMAVHRGKAAGKRLYALAVAPDRDLARDAIFWLGHARGEQGFSLLKKLLKELPEGETRRHINFALSQNDSREAAGLLHDISRTDADPEQRGEAMFWLAQEYPEPARDWLLEAVNSEQDDDVLEAAVFAISQLPDGAGEALLLELARDNQKPRSVRRQAIFWLANSGSDSGVAALAGLLSK